MDARTLIAKLVALEFESGTLVSPGIGLPTGHRFGLRGVWMKPVNPENHQPRITRARSDEGLLAYRELDDVLGLADIAIKEISLPRSRAALAGQPDQMRTIKLGIVSLRGQYSVAWGVQGALSIVASLPTFVIFLLFQRYFVKGMTMGAIKG